MGSGGPELRWQLRWSQSREEARYDVGDFLQLKWRRKLKQTEIVIWRGWNSSEEAA